MEQRGRPSYLDAEEDQQFADTDRAATQVPQLVAILNGEDNEQAAAFRREADERDRNPAEYVPTTAARQLYDFARHNPDVVGAHAETLVEHLDSDNEAIRRRIAFAVMHAVTEPESFVEYAPTFITLLDADDIAVQRTAAAALGHIATVSPEDAVPAVDTLVILVSNPDTRFIATKALARIGYERPKEITSAAQPVIQHFQSLPVASGDLESDEIVFRVAALEVIAQISLVAPEKIGDVSDALRRAVQSNQEKIRIQSIHTIGILISGASDRFATLEPDLRIGFNDDASNVRRATAHAYVWIALNSPAIVEAPAAVAEHLRTLDAEVEDLPKDDLKHALENLDAAAKGDD